MKAWWLGVLAGGLAITTLGVATPAAPAKSGYFVWPGFRENSFSMKGTNGYRITITHTGRRIELAASKGDALAAYIVRSSKPSPDGDIEATFPGRGRVSVRFQPTGPPRRSPPFYPPACNGGGEIDQRGRFKGTIRFRGENGFTRGIATSARGYLHQAFKEVCEEDGPVSRSKPEPSYSLSAFAKTPSGSFSFSALRPAPGSTHDPEATFFGSAYKRRHGMTEVKLAVAHAGVDSFTIGGPSARPTSADVAPPAPFEGSASFEHIAAGQLDWAGTLTVDLPGVDGLRLTGPSFQAQLCLNRRCTGPTPSAAAKRLLLE
jgi:hypothetical protein